MTSFLRIIFIFNFFLVSLGAGCLWMLMDGYAARSRSSNIKTLGKYYILKNLEKLFDLLPLYNVHGCL